MKRKNICRLVPVLLSAFMLLPAGAYAASPDPQKLTLSAPVLKGGFVDVEIPNNYSQVSTEEMQQIDRSMRAFVPAADSLIKNKAKDFYYYSQLNTFQQDMYDAIMMITEYPDQEDNYSILFTDVNPESDAFYKDMGTVYTALTLDHPELFWMRNFSEAEICAVSDEVEEDSIYAVYFFFAEPYKNYKTEMTAFNSAAEGFLSDIDTGGSEMDTAIQIHDKLIEMVTYDEDTAEEDVARGGDLAHSAYGALVKNSVGLEHTAVCDGYSLAFLYLLQQVGIEAAVVPGVAGSEDAFGGHAWNIVNLDGTWYEVDATWDDSLESLEAEINDPANKSIDGYAYFKEAIEDADYRNVLTHYLYGVSTPSIRHYTPSDDEVYITNDQLYVIDLLGESEHIRDDEADPDSFYGGLVASLPNAAGSLH